MNDQIHSKFRGCLLGLAAGDALGTTLEFKPPGSFEPIDDIVGGGPFNLEPGQWTDDTSMALCLAESLIECKGFDIRDQIERYVRWRNERYLSSTGTCADIGNTVSAALDRFEQFSDPIAGSTHPNSAGNGSLMRLAPVPMFYAQVPETAINRARESSETTHRAVECLDACKYYAGLLVGALNGAPKNTILSDRYAPIPSYWTRNKLAPKVDEIALGSFKRRVPPEIKGTGYVVHCLEAALWAFYTTDSFEEGALRAANLGDDADTTAAVYGQIAGAHYGEKGIPPRWLDKLAMRNRIESFADDLERLSRAHGSP